MDKVKGTATVGLKRLTVRILYGKPTPTLGENLYVIEGQEGQGAMSTAKISGLKSDPTKSFGSNIAYHVNNRGVGDVKVELGILDIPVGLYITALGFEEDDDILDFGADTVSANVAILLESNLAGTGKAFYGFYKGQLSMDGIDLETIKDKSEELVATNMDFTASASDDVATKDKYGTMYFGSDEQKIKKLKGKLKMVAAG